MAVLGDVLGIPIVGAERDPVRAELPHERQQRLQVAGHRRFADQQPHAVAETLASLIRRERLVVGTDARGRIGVQSFAEETGRVAVDLDAFRQPQLVELALVGADDARKVHHLCEPEHPLSSQQTLQVAALERAPRRLELGRRNAGGGHEVEVERQALARVEQPVDSVGSEDVRELVRIEHDCGCPERQDEPGELVGKQLGRLEMHVRVDEAWNDVVPACVDDLAAVVLAQTRDPAVHHRHVQLQPLAGENRQDATSANDDVGGFVAAGHG